MTNNFDNLEVAELLTILAMPPYGRHPNAESVLEKKCTPEQIVSLYNEADPSIKPALYEYISRNEERFAGFEIQKPPEEDKSTSKDEPIPDEKGFMSLTGETLGASLGA